MLETLLVTYALGSDMLWFLERMFMTSGLLATISFALVIIFASMASFYEERRNDSQAKTANEAGVYTIIAFIVCITIFIISGIGLIWAK